MYKTLVSCFLFLFFLHSHLGNAQPSTAKTAGYKNGKLIVIGGGKPSNAVMDKFRLLAGGDSARIVVIPTAAITPNNPLTLYEEGIKTMFANYGMPNITLLHTTDTTEANNPLFYKPITEATGLFFTGGRQWRIADAFLHTKAHAEMFKLLDRGGVIAGSSAGATIQGSYLARGDTRNNQIMMGDHEEGLGFITNIAIDQHVLARNRQFDMFEIIKNKPALLGIGIDESTAIVVEQDQFEVIGESYVLIYDNGFWSREGSALKNLPDRAFRFYFLKQGDKYNLENRVVIDQ